MIDWINALIHWVSSLPANIADAISRSFIMQDRYQLWLEGLQNTLTITLFALILGLVVGVLLAIVRVVHDAPGKSHPLLRILNRIAKMYISLIRGIPMMVQLLIWNFFILAASRNLVLIAIIAFGVNSSAYVSELFRGGIMSIDKGQMEAGRSLGLSYRHTMIKIIMPQAIKNSLPVLGNEFIALLKETSIVGVIAVRDVTRVGDIIRAATFDPTPLVFVAAFYWIVVLFLEFLVGRMERRLRRSDHR